MSNRNIAVVGTDTAAGKLLLEKLEENELLDIDELYPIEKLPEEYASLRFRKKTCLINKLEDFDFTQVQVVFFVCGKNGVESHIERAIDSGCYVIDDTSACIDGLSPLMIIPEINGDQVFSCGSRYFVSPNAITIQTAMAMKDIVAQFGVEKLSITALESVSGEGQTAVTELANQAISLFNTKPIVTRHFPVQIAFNTIPSITDFESGADYSAHELSVLEEIENFMPELSGKVCVNSFHVPVFYGHSSLISFSTTMPVALEELRDVLRNSELVSYVEKEIVTPATHGVSKEKTTVTRLRCSTGCDNDFSMYSVIDNTLKGEVLNCIQIAQKIFEEL